MKTYARSLSAAGLFGAALVFYLYTLAPSLVWGDGVKLQTEVALGGSVYLFFDNDVPIASDGLPFARLGAAAWDHPLYVMLGQPFLALPWGDAAFRVNLISALAAALAVALTYCVGLLLVDRTWPAALGALALAVSHTFWWHAVTAEVYALHLLFAISLIGLTLRWFRRRQSRDLMWFALFAGLGLANHLMLMLILIPSIAFITLTALRDRYKPRLADHLAAIRHILWSPYSFACAVLFSAGLAPWWIQFARMVQRIGWPVTLLMAVGYPFLPGSLALRSINTLIMNGLTYAAWLTYQYTPIGVGLGIYGGFWLWRTQRRLAGYLLTLLAFQVVFSANYNVADRFAFHLPSYLIFALFLIAGLARVAERFLITRRQRVLMIGLAFILLVMAPVLVYAATPPALHALGITDHSVGLLPIGNGVRDGLETFLNPNQRGNDSASRFGRSTMDQLAPNALVLTPNHVDGEAYLVLRYYQLVEHRRPDVHLELLLFQAAENAPQAALDLMRAQSPCRAVYVASLNPQAYPLEELQREFDITAEANLYRLHPRDVQRTTAPCPELDQLPANASLEHLMQEVMQWR